VKLAAALISLLALFALPAALHADKQKKAPATQPAKLGDQRQKAYFDISKIVWPNPPAIARIKFIDLFTGEKVDSKLFAKEKPKQKWMDRLAGQQTYDEIKVTSLPFQLIRTYGVAVDSKGKIYAADQAVGAIFIFDPENKDKVELIGNGKQASFALIVGLAVDDNDHFFVSDARMHRVLAFNEKHEQEASIGMDVLVRPGGIALDRENRFLYVADTGQDVIQVFDADTYKLLRHIGKPSKKHDQTDPGTFSLPECVAVDNDGNVYVTDTFNNRVEIFDADGAFVNMFGKNGDGPADLERPKGIAIDGDGHIWVVDDGQDRVKVFNTQGRLLIYMGDHGFYPGQFMGAWGIAVDNKTNRVIVSETYPGRVQMFRYVTDAEAAAEKAKREGGEQKPDTHVVAPKPSVAQPPPATGDASAKKDAAAR